MADLNEVLNQYLDRAELLIGEKKLKDAYALCVQVLESDPGNRRAFSLKGEIEQLIENFNVHTIDNKLEALKPLWEKGEYEQLVKELAELRRLAPHYEKLETALAQAQAMYRNSYNAEQSSATKTYQAQLADLLNQKKYPDLIELMQQNARAASISSEIRELHTTFREKIITAKIAEKKSLFESEKYEDIVNYLYGLQSIDKSSPTLTNYLRTFREKLLKSQIDEKREFIIRSSENAKTLYQIGKYEKAMEASNEILHIDPKNTLAKSIHQLSRSAFESMLQEQTEEQISQNAELYRQEMTTQPQGFMKI